MNWLYYSYRVIVYLPVQLRLLRLFCRVVTLLRLICLDLQSGCAIIADCYGFLDLLNVSNFIWIITKKVKRNRSLVLKSRFYNLNNKYRLIGDVWQYSTAQVIADIYQKVNSYYSERVDSMCYLEWIIFPLLQLYYNLHLSSEHTRPYYAFWQLSFS